MANQEHLDKVYEGVEAWNEWREENADITPDLKEANLTRANFTRANLTRANLKGADLSGAYLGGAHLEGARLEGAHLEEAYLEGAHLEGAHLVHTHLVEAYLVEAYLVKADLWRANLEGANLEGANLEGANLEGANLEKATVMGVHYNRWTRYKGAQVDSCVGNARFKRFALDQQFIEEFRESKWRWPFYAVWLVLSDCGRSLALWSAWSLAIAVFFGFKYYSMGKDCFNGHFETALPWAWETMMYYSVVTFTTLGYGDISPKTIEAAQWVTAEVVIGYIMLGGMISILATKLARRS